MFSSRSHRQHGENSTFNSIFLFTLAAVFGLLVRVSRQESRELDSNSVSNVMETINRGEFKCLVSAIFERKCTFS